MSDSDKLKSCPFCGSPHVKLVYARYRLNGPMSHSTMVWSVTASCKICIAVRKPEPDESRETAKMNTIALWNMRAERTIPPNTVLVKVPETMRNGLCHYRCPIKSRGGPCQTNLSKTLRPFDWNNGNIIIGEYKPGPGCPRFKED